MNDTIRSLFPATKHLTYLNSAAVWPMPTIAIEAINGQLADVAAYGSAHYQDWIDTKNRARSLIAEMLGTSQMVIAVTLHRARGRLRKEISKLSGDR